MNARLAAIRGRTVGLVQRPRRKMHFGSIAAGDTAWVTICDRDVLAAGTSFWTRDSGAIEIGDEHADAMCAHCFRMLLVATVLAGQVGDVVAALGSRRAG